MKHQTYVRYLHAHFSTQKGQIPLWPHRYFKQGGTSKYYEPTKRAQVVLYKEAEMTHKPPMRMSISSSDEGAMGGRVLSRCLHHLMTVQGAAPALPGLVRVTLPPTPWTDVQRVLD